jgi:hypothetical protein
LLSLRFPSSWGAASRLYYAATGFFLLIARNSTTELFGARPSSAGAQAGHDFMPSCVM